MQTANVTLAADVLQLQSALTDICSPRASHNLPLSLSSLTRSPCLLLLYMSMQRTIWTAQI